MTSPDTPEPDDAPPQTELEQRQAQALEMHLANASYDQIAEHLDYADRSGAYRAVQAALRRQRYDHDAATSLPGETELARINAMITGLWPKARRGDVAAVDRVMKLEERRGKLEMQLRLAEKPPEPATPTDSEGTPLDELERRRAEREATRSRRTTG